ncbi:outer membrane protein assembly factor [Devosia sp. BSSL-BM10]|uniref:Outer membrane protein assembly factor n=2 Tax=Devosia litorisediminis TaxID=2829817 RepID=A0A942E339_9HYPH|nr:autotransporter assembly complex family protein [Devosia litorisediminis]MBS3847333.1 outer membrane protein assembly factor [Devosia litorisediminis]
MAAAPVAAFEIFGLKLFEDPNAVDAEVVIADPQPYVVSVAVNGDGALESVVRNASSLVADETKPASGAAGLLAKARGDYRRLVAALYNEGYYGGVVSIRVGGQEAAKLAPDVNLPDPVDVAIVVEPGPLFRFNSVDVVNAAPITSDPFDFVPPPSTRGFGRGEIAKSSVILQAEQLALRAWRQQGFPKAVIASREVVADHANSSVDVTITVNPGRKAAFGDVTVTGTERMDPEFVRRQTGLVVGEEYDPDTLALAQKRLDRLEVFRAARLEAAESIGVDGLLPYTLIVQELPGARFGVGANYSSIDGLGVEGYHLWRNLFGQAERLRLDARIASIAYPIDTEQFDYSFGGTFTKPGIFTPDTDLVAAVAAERTIYPTYTETSASGRLGLTHIFSDEITIEGGASLERSRFDDSFGTRDFTTAGLYGGATLDFRNDRVDATAGWYAQASVEPFYEFRFANAGARVTLEGRTYFGFGENDPFVLAGRIKGGALVGPALSEISPDKLFFAGGGGSVRGYGYKSIGVNDGAGNVTGGRYLLEGSLEARMRINEAFGIVGFLDGGYVAADVFPSIDDLRLGAGAGLRYYTGLGPLRLDAAIPLNKKPGDADYAVYVGIGQAF